MPIRVDRQSYLLSGISAQGGGTPVLDLRGSNGTFRRWFSGSGNGPSAGASAIFDLFHSHDRTAWQLVERVTASGGETGDLVYSAGQYAYLMASAALVYSAAETGTGSVWVHVRGGVS